MDVRPGRCAWGRLRRRRSPPSVLTGGGTWPGRCRWGCEPPRRWPRASGGRGDSGTAGGRTQPAVGRGTQFGQEAELRHMGGGGPQLGRSPARIRPSTPLFFSSRERNLCLCRTRPVSTGRRPRAWLCWARAGRPGVGDGPEPACTPRPHRAGRGRSPSLAGDAAPCGTLSCPREASRGDVHVHLREAPPRTRPAAAASAEAWGTHGAAGEGVPAAVPGARGVQPPSPVRTRPPSPLPGCGSWTLRRCPRTRGLLASSPETASPPACQRESALRSRGHRRRAASLSPPRSLPPSRGETPSCARPRPSVRAQHFPTPVTSPASIYTYLYGNNMFTYVSYVYAIYMLFIYCLV